MTTEPLPGPARVQIQTQAGCNGRCVFCPNEATLRQGLPLGRMAPELFRKIIDELAETGPRRILLYLQNEPLNDQRLPEFTRYVAERMPDVTTLVTTNGTGLTREIGEQLIDAGLKRMKVSLQSLDDATNRALMGYDAAGVVENVIAFQQLIRRTRSKLDLRVSTVVTSKNRAEIEDARRFWRRQGVRLVTSALENRGGNIGNIGELGGDRMQARSNCIRPAREMCVLFNGQVVLCCVDWFRTVIAGDLTTQSIREVWNGPVYARIRQGMRDGDAEKLPQICINCTENVSPSVDRHSVKGLLRRVLPRRRK